MKGRVFHYVIVYGLLVFTLTMSMLPAGSQHDSKHLQDIECSSIRVIGSNGEPCALLMGNEHGGMLVLMSAKDDTNPTRLVMSVDHEDGATMRTYDAQSQIRHSFIATKYATAYTLYDSNGKNNVVLISSGTAGGLIQLTDSASANIITAEK